MPDIFDERAKVYQEGNSDIFTERAKLYKKPSKIKDVAKQGTKGFASGLAGAPGDIRGAIDKYIQDPLLNMLGLEAKKDRPKLPTTVDINEFLTRDLGFGEPETAAGRVAEHSGQLAGGAALFGPGAIGSAALSGAVGQTARELGAPDLVATGLEVGTALKGRAPKGLTANKAMQKEVQYLKGKGLTDKEITPILQSERKVNFLKTFANKGNKTQAALEKTRAKVGELYQPLEEKFAKVGGLKGENYVKFQDEYSDILRKLPIDLQNAVKQSGKKLFLSPMKGGDFIEFWKEINRKVKGIQGAKQQLNLFKNPVQKAMRQLSPELTDEYQLINSLYGKAKGIQRALRPKEFEEALKPLVKPTKVIGTLGSLLSGNPKYAAALGLTHLYGKLSTALLTSPKLQNIGAKLIEAAKQNKTRKALVLTNQFLKEASKKDKDIPSSVDQSEQSNQI